MLAKNPYHRFTSRKCLEQKFLCELGFDKTIISAARNCLSALAKFDRKGKLQIAIIKYIISRVLKRKEIDMYKEAFFYLNKS